jgi:hypothetical protein
MTFFIVTAVKSSDLTDNIVSWPDILSHSFSTDWAPAYHCIPFVLIAYSQRPELSSLLLACTTTQHSHWFWICEHTKWTAAICMCSCSSCICPLHWTLLHTSNHDFLGYNGKLHNFYSSASIIRIIKSRRMRWAGHVARMREKRNVYRLLVGKPGERDH